MVYKVKQKRVLDYSYHYLRFPGPGGVHMQLHAGLTFLQLRIVYNQDLHKCQSDLVRVKPFIIFATWVVREIGLMSFPTDLTGICLGRGGHNCVFQRRRYNAFTQRGIIHISNQWREFKGELLEYYIRYAIWS